MKHLAVLLASAAIFLPLPLLVAHAADRVVLGVGYYDISDDEEALDLRAEIRWDEPVFWKLKPFAGVEVTTDAAVYALGGLYADFEVAPHWFITPSIGAGLYAEGDGKDLDHPVEFRTQLELAYEFEDQSRVSVGFSHISNADLGDDNPGTEILGVYYHVPLDRLFGKK